MTTTAVIVALVLLFIIALIKRFIKFAIVLALLAAAYWYFAR